MFVVIDGAEKAGKTTLAMAIIAHANNAGLTTKYRHFTGADPVTDDSLDEIMDDLDQVALVVWDRSWASGQVYGDLGFHQRPEAVKAEGEILFKGVQPVKLMLLGASAEALAAKRTIDDLPVEPAVEREAFADYAKQHDWPVMANEHREGDLELLIDCVLTEPKVYAKPKGY